MSSKFVENKLDSGEAKVDEKFQYGWGYEDGKHTIQKFRIPIPVPKEKEVLIKIEAAGLCQSDNHVLIGGPIPSRDPVNYPIKPNFIMGHEIAGSVAQIGEGLKGDPRYAPGTRFALSIANSCGVCESCRGGKDNSCDDTSYSYGLNIDGGFQQYLLVKNLKTLLPIPENVSYEVAAIASDSVLTPFHAIQKVRQYLNPTTKVLLVGLGGLGLNALQILRHYGCYIVASDIKLELKQIALEKGADEYHIDMSESDHNIESFNVVIDCVGVQPSSDLCQTYVASQGKYLTIGLGRSKLFIHNYLLARREVEIIFSFGGTTLEQIEVMKWISKGIITPVTSTANLDDIPYWLKQLHHGKVEGRIVFKPKSTKL
jgi:propanol-preferring alcohol dehydrogenase